MKVNVELIPGGALPIWHPDPGFPVFSFRSDGKSVLKHKPGQVLLQTFELASADRDSLGEEIVDRIKSLCLAAGFPGRAHVLVLGDSIRSSVDGVAYSVELGIGYTWDHEEDMPGLRTSVLACDIPNEIGDEAFATVDLLKLGDAFVVMSVMSA